MAISYSPERAKQLDNFCCVSGYLVYGEGTASLYWVARSFLLCDDKTMTFAEQQDKSFDNSPLEEAVDLLHKWYHLRPRHLKVLCNRVFNTTFNEAVDLLHKWYRPLAMTSEKSLKTVCLIQRLTRLWLPPQVVSTFGHDI